MWVSETIDASSTSTTSCGSRLARWWRNRVRLSGRQPSSRCRVIASTWASGSTTARACGSGVRSRIPAIAPSSAALTLAAALPVGAASPTRSGRPPAAAACSASSASTPATVVVLPVPGPPVSTLVRARVTTSAAARCSAYPSPGKIRNSPAESTASSTAGGSSAARARRSSTTCTSWWW